MGKIIHFPKNVDRIDNSQDLFECELEELLKRSVELSKKFKKSKDSKGVRLKNEKDFRNLIEHLISEEIFLRKKISSDHFLCGNYVSTLMASLFKSSPKSWIVFDYELSFDKTGRVETLKEGADICFLICSVFEKRARWKLMSPSFYRKKGESLYHLFYLAKRKEVHYHMSSNFKEMADITKVALSKC